MILKIIPELLKNIGQDPVLMEDKVHNKVENKSIVFLISCLLLNICQFFIVGLDRFRYIK